MRAIAASGNKFRTEPTFSKVLKDMGEQWVQLAVFQVKVSLILDEATSALDLATEAEIMTTLERIAKKCTVIVITHRMAHALRAKVMFVMDKECLVVSG
ncbi:MULTISPECIES: hypothetical protein [unclassified Microcoleus]|uniref:hypothetical protein n=1 Tax=unclassified Microcoleus TaxID=2642155 RepID=UPI002FD23FDF